MDKLSEEIRPLQEEHDALLRRQSRAATDPFVERCAKQHAGDEMRTIECQVEAAKQANAELEITMGRSMLVFDQLATKQHAYPDRLMEGFGRYQTLMWAAILGVVIGVLSFILGLWRWWRSEHRTAEEVAWPKLHRDGDA